MPNPNESEYFREDYVRDDGIAIRESPLLNWLAERDKKDVIVIVNQILRHVEEIDRKLEMIFAGNVLVNGRFVDIRKGVKR